MKRRTDIGVFALALAAAGVAASAVIGFLIDDPFLFEPLPTLPGMFLTGALAIFLGAAALLLGRRTQRTERLRAILGAFVATIGALGALQWLSATQWGIDLASLALNLRSDWGLPEPGLPSPVACVCLMLLGVGVAALPLAARRHSVLPLATVAVIAAMFGATTLAGYLFRIEFLISWPSRTPMPPQSAAAITFLGLGLWRAVLLRAQGDAESQLVDKARLIEMTAVWVLALCALVAGVSTFALAQYEYRDLARADLERTLRERRAFLEYALTEHTQQVSLAAALPDLGAVRASRRVALETAARTRTQHGFSGWRYEIGDEVVSAGNFIDNPVMRVQLHGPFATELLWREGYYLRTRLALHDGTRLVGHAVAEEPFPELTRLKLLADSRGETGEMALCAIAPAETAMRCFPLRSNPDAALVPRTIRGKVLPMSRALDFETGVEETLDYRQHRVLAAYGPVGFTGLGMVIKIDAAELNEPLGRRFGEAMLMLFALAAGGVWLTRRRLRPLTAALVNAREESARVAQQFKAAAESSLDAYFILDCVRDTRGAIANFRVSYMNASGEVLSGRPSEEIRGRTLQEALPPAEAAFFLDRYRRIVQTGESLNEEFRTTNSEVGVLWVAHQAVKLGDGVSVTARDITQRKTIEAQLRERAENDVLTGMPNRARFFERLEGGLKRARAERTGVAVLFLDLDHFKQVNDRNGHAAGDAVLVEFARRLRSSVRETDIVARLGGDEFAILLADIDATSEAETVAMHIVAAIGEPFVVEGRRLHVTTSIGIGYCARGMETAQSLLARADRKLYQAKAAGRGRFASAQESRAA